MTTYGFIGTGNMGGALATAISRAGGERKLLLNNRSIEKAESLAAEIGGEVIDMVTCAQQADFLFLGVKPQMMETVLTGLYYVLKSREKPPVLVTMAAGLSIDRILEMACCDYPIIRIMPNTPVSIGKGMVLYTGRGVSESEWQEFLAAMQPCGRLEELPEALIDAGSAVSGCGPAFVYLFIEALADGGVECGLPRDKALQLAAQTVAGAAELMLQSGKHPGALKDAVCSPGGTTIAGVHALEKGAFRALGMDAVQAAYEKNQKMI